MGTLLTLMAVGAVAGACLAPIMFGVNWCERKLKELESRKKNK
jgi:hypothetical protein